MLVIEELFSNLGQATAEEQVVGTNLTDANDTPTAQVTVYENHLDTKEAGIMALTKKVRNLKNEVNNMKAQAQGGTCTRITYPYKREYKPHPTWLSAH